MKGGESILENVLLGLLAQKPQSGYDLRTTFATTAMRYYSDSPGSIYPALKRLEKRGLIVPAGSVSERASRRRKAYELTDAGAGVLRAWLERPVSREQTRLHRDELMLRFAFMDGNVPRGTAVRFLQGFERELAAYIAELRTQFAHMRERLERKAPGASAHTGMLAFEARILEMEAQAAWAQAAMDKLKAAE